MSEEGLLNIGKIWITDHPHIQLDLVFSALRVTEVRRLKICIVQKETIALVLVFNHCLAIAGYKLNGLLWIWHLAMFLAIPFTSSRLPTPQWPECKIMGLPRRIKFESGVIVFPTI